MKNKLNRMKQHLSSAADQKERVYKPPNTGAEMQKAAELPFEKKWKDLSASPLFFDGNVTWKRDVTYEFDHQHGNYRFSELLDVFEQWEKETAYHPLHPEHRKPEDLLFFDTETTGLNSGAGNMIFILGGARLTEKEVLVRQFFLPGPEAEVAFYYHFLKDMPPERHLVTYNGKSFDWPQLKTRHTFVRNEVPKLPAFGHFDLLHAARRLFKHQLESCRLSVVEKEILGFERTDDTPGYLAPMLYFDFLEEKHPELIEGVLKHNEWDVLSLITLYIDLSKRVLNRRTPDQEKFEIGRWYEASGEPEKAAWCYEKALASINSEETWYASCAFSLGKLLKKQKRHEKANMYFQKVMELKGPLQIEAAVELAKFAEHKQQDIDLALNYTVKAREQKLEIYSGEQDKRSLREILIREERLRSKSQGK
ncbi:ribonuclease H-like domain-containing protein [Alteribacillus sp. HJP-4]|uniref:ribonuclease H-like domain-containing protein n=1 Tax=Alteribacillus sp. HJP-4 TaxID=2775394 RepID=UPI0035CD19FC